MDYIWVINTMNRPSPLAIHPSVQHNTTLKKPIAAINTGTRSSSIAQLPAEANLEVCGEGFNHRTLTVRWQDELYFVFEQDLESGHIEGVEAFSQN